MADSIPVLEGWPVITVGIIELLIGVYLGWRQLKK